MSQTFLLFLSFVLSAITVSSILRKSGFDLLSGVGGRISIGLGVGPLLISVLICVCFLVIPRLQDIVYIIIVFSIFTLSSVCLNKEFLRKPFVNFSFKKASFILTPFFIFLVLNLVMGLFAVLIFPLYSNDPLEYFKTAQILTQYKDLSVYPIVDVSVSNGFYGPWTHPPGYVALLTWANLLSDGDSHNVGFTGAARLISWWFSLCTVLLMLSWNKKIGVIAAFLMCSVPIYFAGVSSSHIDAVRIFPVLLTFIVLQRMVFLNLWESKLYEFILMSSIGLFLCFYTHSIGIIVAPLWGVILMFLAPGFSVKQLVQKIKIGLIVAIFFVALSSLFVYSNYKSTGALITDTPVVWSIDKINHNEYVNAQRKIDTPLKKFINGVMKGLVNLTSYGAIFWL